MGVKLRSWWQQIKQHRVAIGVAGITLVVLLASIIVGYRFDWTGFNGYNQVTIAHTISGSSAGTVVRTEVYQPGKALWDWLQLLIIPLVLAVGALLFNLAATRTEQKITAQRYEQDQQIAKQHYEQDQHIALDKQREDLLQAYLDRMSELLLKESLRTSPSEEVRNVARVRTITTLLQLDVKRIGYVFAFLNEAGLMSETSNDNAVNLNHADFQKVPWSQARLSAANLTGANLKGAELTGAELIVTNLTGATLTGATLDNANLSFANLTGADLIEANLKGADLRGVHLEGANLEGANLTEADLGEVHLDFFTNLSKANLTRAILSKTDLTGARLFGANLTGANLDNANLSGAWLNNADLSGANLSEANLSKAQLWDAKVTDEQLNVVRSLEGALMPDGAEYETSQYRLKRNVPALNDLVDQLGKLAEGWLDSEPKDGDLP